MIETHHVIQLYALLYDVSQNDTMDSLRYIENIWKGQHILWNQGASTKIEMDAI